MCIMPQVYSRRDRHTSLVVSSHCEHAFYSCDGGQDMYTSLMVLLVIGGQDMDIVLTVLFVIGGQDTSIPRGLAHHPACKRHMLSSPS